MALTKKISLLCMSILTLSCINNNLYSMNIINNLHDIQNNPNNAKKFPNLFKIDHHNQFNNNLGWFSNNNSDKYDNMLDLYKCKYYLENTGKNNNFKGQYGLNRFTRELQQNLNSITETDKKNKFIGKIKNILGKFNVDISNELNNKNFVLLNKNNVNKDLSNALLNDFLDGKQLSSNLIIRSIFLNERYNDKLANFILKCIILNLNANEKFDLLWNLCDKCDTYKRQQNEYSKDGEPLFNYMMKLVQTLSRIVLYDINELNKSKNND